MVIESLNMKEGCLPVWYLGVPLISKQLSSLDCEVLLDKISSKINSWLSRSVSVLCR